MVSLIETLVATAISALLVASLAGYSLAQRPYAIRAAVQNVGALLSDARSVAETSGNGATVVIASTTGGFSASLYPFRPTTGANVGTPPVRSVGGNVIVTSTAIFVSSSGTVSSTSWSPAGGTLAAEPPCTTPIAITFTSGSSSETHTIPCETAELR